MAFSNHFKFVNTLHLKFILAFHVKNAATSWISWELSRSWLQLTFPGTSYALCPAIVWQGWNGLSAVPNSWLNKSRWHFRERTVSSCPLPVPSQAVFVIHPQCRIWIGKWNATVANYGLRFGIWNAGNAFVDWIPGLGLYVMKDWTAEWESNPGIQQSMWMSHYTAVEFDVRIKRLCSNSPWNNCCSYGGGCLVANSTEKLCVLMG